MTEPRCDLHGPYTATQAAAMLHGWRPERTGYICDECRELVRHSAQAMADEIDAKALAEITSERAGH